jgi:hypothetical protein
MTDALRPIGRAWPGRPFPGRARPGEVRPDLPGAGTRPAVRPIGARAAVAVRSPYHLGVLLGVSAGAYAASLAGVTFLQASSEAATAAVRAPAAAAIERMATDNDRLEQALATARERLTAAGDDYGAAAVAVSDLQARLESLAALVSDIEGESMKLPTRISLPARASLPSAPRAAAASAPKTVATTGASGG